MHHTTEDTVRVLIRVRPKLQVNSSGIDESASNNLTIDERNNAISIGRGEKKGISEYKFTSVLGPQVTQADVFNRCSDVVQESINGINCCIMAYGQVCHFVLLYFCFGFKIKFYIFIFIHIYYIFMYI